MWWGILWSNHDNYPQAKTIHWPQLHDCIQLYSLLAPMKICPRSKKFGCLDQLLPIGGAEDTECRKVSYSNMYSVSLTCTLELGGGGGTPQNKLYSYVRAPKRIDSGPFWPEKGVDVNHCNHYGYPKTLAMGPGSKCSTIAAVCTARSSALQTCTLRTTLELTTLTL